MNRVDVTQEDIDKGEGYHPAKCAIALALNRKFPCRNIQVSWHFILFDSIHNIHSGWTGGVQIPHTLSQPAALDHKQNVEPFAFLIGEGRVEEVYD